MFGLRLLPVLMMVALVCVLAAAVLVFFNGRSAAGGALSGDPAWQSLVDSAAQVREGEQTVAAVSGAAAKVRELMPRLLAEMNDLSGEMGGALAPHLERFEMHGQHLLQGLAALTAGAGDPADTAQRLAESADYLGRVLRGLAGQDPGLGIPRATGAAESRLRTVQALFEEIDDRTRGAISAAQALVPVQAAAGEMDRAAQALAARAATLDGGSNLLGGILPLVLLGVAFLAVLGAAVIYASTANIRRAAEAQARQNQRNQDAILRLLDELSSLADGDLTVQATVTEDITGAIADSINYAIEALRDLVTTINDSAIKLDAASKQTQALSSHLAKASSAQSRQIASATESTAEMAASTEEVSGNAERAADVARHSVDVAGKGGHAVRRTIDGMNAIRETIQDTSKRIKRLGESSQEIGNIVELINDIAEQTNILALNASIQASMAGEAGRGFAVVADEVQRLAERAANATKQIEVLVRTIQTDTNEAVVSMERSTTDVVGGALLAENAGAALEEIEQVSNQIASLVQNISASSRGQATAAANVSRNMQVLREISSQTADSTSATSTAIGKLAELAAQLRKSVSGFRLPNAPKPPAVAKPGDPKQQGSKPGDQDSATAAGRAAKSRDIKSVTR
jgi:twitching motility protein PilJ